MNYQLETLKVDAKRWAESIKGNEAAKQQVLKALDNMKKA